MLGIGNEISIFISAFLAGNLICLIYSAIRVFRRLVRHSLIWISVEDFVFWVGVGLYLFSEMFRTCNGNIRWYFVLGVLLGGIITIWFMQKLKKGIARRHKRE